MVNRRLKIGRLCYPLRFFGLLTFITLCRTRTTIAPSHSSLNRRTSLNDMVDAQLFVNIAKTVFGGYSAMMLLMPKKMVTDHFKQECDPSAIQI